MMNLQLVSSATLDEETQEVTLVFLEQWDDSKDGGPAEFQPTKRVTVVLPLASMEDIEN